MSSTPPEHEEHGKQPSAGKKGANVLAVQMVHGDILILDGDDFQVSFFFSAVCALRSVPMLAYQVRNKTYWALHSYVASQFSRTAIIVAESLHQSLLLHVCKTTQVVLLSDCTVK
jgi:hypothetical protein